MGGKGANGLQLLRRLQGSFRARWAAVVEGDVGRERLRRERLGRMREKVRCGIRKGEKVHKTSAGFLIVGRHLQVEFGCLCLYYIQ